MAVKQLPLFPVEEAKGKYGPLVRGMPPPLTRDSPLSAAIDSFKAHMIEEGFTENTIKAFLSDLRIFSRYLGFDRAIGQIATKDLNNFLTYLQLYRGKPCSPKSYARRVTTLKSFFGWLAEEGIIPNNPAAPIAQPPASSPLPQILYQSQVAKLLETTRGLMHAEKPDARPHLLVTLLLQTGIKKSECINIELNHIDLSDPEAPVLYIRYADPRKRHKERKLLLPSDFAPTLRQYLEEYHPKEKLFECTARNLEYVLDKVAQMAGLDNVSFETLRWTCAVRDYQAGMPPDKLRRKLGLSKIRWSVTLRKLEKLAGPAL